MDQKMLGDLFERIESKAVDTIEGVVVTHGTDTIEESAYYLDVALSPGSLVVFTGAQRRPNAPGADGPANLSTAVSAASELANRLFGGSYVAFNEEFHVARDVTKAHTHKLEGFESPGSGRSLPRSPERFRFHRRPGSRSTPIPPRKSESTVEVILNGIGIEDAQIGRALDAGVDGLVLEGTGLGNVAPGIVEAVEDAFDRAVPIVLTSRWHAGAVGAVYETAGGFRP